MAESQVVRLFADHAPDAAAAAEHIRAIEAILFAATEPVSIEELRNRLPSAGDVGPLLAELQAAYASRGVNLVQVAGKWAFRTAPDLSFMMTRERIEQRKLSRAALETLAIIAYHQPVTRAEIEEIRGVSLGTGTLDVLLESGWIRIRGRRKTPGRPVTYGTSDAFLEHFGLNAIEDLPGVEELTAAGLVSPGHVITANASDEEEPLDGCEDDLAEAAGLDLASLEAPFGDEESA